MKKQPNIPINIEEESVVSIDKPLIQLTLKDISKMKKATDKILEGQLIDPDIAPIAAAYSKTYKDITKCVNYFAYLKDIKLEAKSKAERWTQAQITDERENFKHAFFKKDNETKHRIELLVAMEKIEKAEYRFKIKREKLKRKLSKWK